ncbi:MAG: hypothetical protein M3517_10855 [Actinomycetota bacterium]|nr:hypothetical protein [Actinomycetota bacterium]
MLHGEIPNPIHPQPGCRVQTRCPLAQDRCRHEAPPLEKTPPVTGRRAFPVGQEPR